MKKKFLFILFCVFSAQGFSQQAISWQKTIGGDNYEQLGVGGLWPTTDGGMVLGGRSYSYISGDKTENNRGVDGYWVVKY